MHKGYPLLTKQAAHNGFQFLLTATCIDRDRVPEMNDNLYCESGVRQNSPPLYPQNSIMSDHTVVSG